MTRNQAKPFTDSLSTAPNQGVARQKDITDLRTEIGTLRSDMKHWFVLLFLAMLMISSAAPWFPQILPFLK